MEGISASQQLLSQKVGHSFEGNSLPHSRPSILPQRLVLPSLERQRPNLECPLMHTLNI